MVANGVTFVTEGRRGCGYRKIGGKYLVSEGISVPCPALPLEVGRCPCCDSGIKPTRSWAWFSPKMFFEFDCPDNCPRFEMGGCGPFKEERAGILWIGGKFYPTPKDWTDEAGTMGVSRRIAQIPKDFVVGKTWVFVGHRKAVTKECVCVDSKRTGLLGMNHPEPDLSPDPYCEECDGTGLVKVPGLFHAFCPNRIEKIVDANISQKEVDKLLKQGITPVVVDRVDEKGRPVDEDGDLLTK